VEFKEVCRIYNELRQDPGVIVKIPGPPEMTAVNQKRKKVPTGGGEPGLHFRKFSVTHARCFHLLRPRLQSNLHSAKFCIPHIQSSQCLEERKIERRSSEAEREGPPCLFIAFYDRSGGAEQPLLL